MSPERSLSKQAGIGLPIALFIITVLALLVAGMAQLQESSSKAVSLQIQSQRAFFAAESGVQAGAVRVLESIDGLQCFSGRIDFLGAGLSGCSAEVSCDQRSEGEVVELTSRGFCGSGMDAATRTVEVRFR